VGVGVVWCGVVWCSVVCACVEGGSRLLLRVVTAGLKQAFQVCRCRCTYDTCDRRNACLNTSKPLVLL
jgi:hypothetical protein